jgi:hypothetical protein
MFVLGPPKDVPELVFFLFGDSRSSEFFYAVISEQSVCFVFMVRVSAYTAYEDRTVFQNARHCCFPGTRCVQVHV